MPGEPFRQANLVRPAEAFLGVLGKLDIVRGGGVDEIVGREVQRLEVLVVQCPAREQGLVRS